MDLNQECVFILIISLALLSFLSSPHQSCLLPIPRGFPFNLISITHRVRKLNSLHHTLPTFTLHYLICTMSCSTPLDSTLLSVNQDRSAWTTGCAVHSSSDLFSAFVMRTVSVLTNSFLFQQSAFHPVKGTGTLATCFTFLYKTIQFPVFLPKIKLCKCL